MSDRAPDRPDHSSGSPRPNLNEVITPLTVSGGESRGKLGIVLVVLIPLMAGFAAAAYGGVEPWSELTLLGGSILVATYAVLEAWKHGLGRGVAIALGLALAYVGLAAFQAIPLPIGLIEWLSPTRYEAMQSLLDETPSYAAVSYYPIDTIQSLRLLFIALAVFGSAAAVSRSVPHAKGMLLGFFILGVCQACLAIAQQATDAQGVYWGGVSDGEVRSGSFLNHSNFAQFLNLTVGASLGLFLVRLSEDRKQGSHHLRRVALTEVFRRHGWLLIGIALQVVAIAASLSRAGLVSMVLAAAVTSLALNRASLLGSSAWSLLLVAPLAFLSLTALGFDAFYHRLDSLQGTSSYADRIQLGSDTLKAGWAHPLLGTGLGTHSTVFPAYDTTGSVAVAEQADNDYAQAFEETGSAGVALLLALAVTVFAAIRRVMTMRHSSAKHAAYGVLYGLVAVGVQSVTDFGQRVPAVFCVTAALAGLVVGMAPRDQASALNKPNRVWRAGLAVFAIAAAVSWAYLARTGLADYRANRWWAAAYELDQRLDADDLEADPQDYVDLIAATEMAAAAQPARIKYAFWLNAYRWEAVQFAAQGADPLATADGRRTAARIADELAGARQLCPTHGPSSTLEGQLRLGVGDPTGARLVSQGVRLAPHDPVCCYVAAVHTLGQPSDAEADRTAFKLLERAVALDRSFYSDAVQVILDTRTNLLAAKALAQNNPRRLRELADRVESIESLSGEKKPLYDQALNLQEKRVANEKVYPEEIADLAGRLVSRGRHEEAATLYRRSLALDFDRNPWRLRLIDTLMRLGKNKEALREVRIVLRQDPKSRQAKDRLGSLVELVEQDAAEPDSRGDL